MRAARGLALGLALGSIGVVGCNHLRGRLGRRASATSFAFTNEKDRHVLSTGYAEQTADGVLRVVLGRAPASGCPEGGASSAGHAERAGARLSFRVPAGPRLDHFVGATIGVRVELDGVGTRGGFGLDAEEVSLRLDRIDAPTGAGVLMGVGEVAGRLTMRERYRRVPGRSAHGEGRFSVRLCRVEASTSRASTKTTRTIAASPASAHVVTLPDGRRALTKLRFGDTLLEHPSGAAEGALRLGSAQPARLRTVDGAIGWDAWVRFDVLELAAGGHVRGAVDARAGDAWVIGDFDAVVEE
jgi:hypothetical protein